MVFEGQLPDLNKYIEAIAVNRFLGGKLKKKFTDKIAWEAQSQKKEMLDMPVFIDFKWFCRNRRIDKDNISSMGRKIILDGLQNANVIAQDSWNAVEGFSDQFFLDKENPRVEIIIKEVKNEKN